MFEADPKKYREWKVRQMGEDKVKALERKAEKLVKKNDSLILKSMVK